jgi:hypothetical protein
VVWDGGKSLNSIFLKQGAYSIFWPIECDL